MKRRKPISRGRQGREAERLAWLARGLANSGSRVEDAFWEQTIGGLVARLLQSGDDDSLNQALDRLAENDGAAYDELADLAEAATEAAMLQDEGGARQLLMVAMPVLVWSRYGIPVGTLPAGVLAGLKVQLAAHVLAEGVGLAFADYLFSPDQLPQGFAATYALAGDLWRAVAAGHDLRVANEALPETGQYISDVRYLLAAVSVASGAPVFRWNEADGRLDVALTQWREQGGANLRPMLPGCVFEMLQPDAYFAAWRRADREGRPFSLRAAVAYLEQQLEVSAGDLRAVIAPYYDQRLLEWRVGFTRRHADEVLHGVVWPLFGADEEGSDGGGEIARILGEAGVGQVTVLDQGLPVEYCDDCGLPLYPNPDGESVHAEMPEREDTAPAQLH